MKVSSIPAILEGGTNNLKAFIGLESFEVEAIAFNRYNICLQCPLISFDKTTCDRSKELNVGGIVTKGCNCLLSIKTRVINNDPECPLKKW